MFRHVVLFRIHDQVDDRIVAAALDELRVLGQRALAFDWRIELSQDERKGRIIVEDVTFADRAQFETFRMSEEHARAHELMSPISHWLVGDYTCESEPPGCR